MRYHKGGVVGSLRIRNSATGEPIQIDCANLGSGAYSIPRSVEHLKFETEAAFALAVETGGMFQRLNYHRFWEVANRIIIEMAGVSTRATRRFIRLLSHKHDLPVYCFTDCDPCGFTNNAIPAVKHPLTLGELAIASRLSFSHERAL